MVSLSKKEEEKNRVPKLDSLSPFQIRGFGVFTLFQNEMVINVVKITLKRQICLNGFDPIIM